ncbi:MAG TPA: TRAP transporter substrate-binding protein [Candidatus Atribacteria bacterium]|nr:TRAP transporter substrate-binding protein [Candidatus Atribacteria bacterium]
MKRILLLTFCLVLVLCLAMTVHAKTERLIFSTMFPESYTYILEPSIDFCKKVEERTGGEVKFDIYHSKQLFGGKQEFAAVGRGEIDLGIPHDIYHTGEVPELGIVSLPFLFEDEDQAMYMLRAGLKEMIRPILEKANNCVLLGWVAFDPYNFYSKKPIRSIEDIKGKIWAVSGTTASKAIEAVGGSPTMMSSSELYLALQTNTIDGCVRPLLTGVGRRLYEVSKYWTQINLSPWGDILILNKDRWDKLTPDVQKIMWQAGREWEDQAFLMAKEFTQTAIKKLKDGGMNISKFPPEEIIKLRKAMEVVYKWWIEEEVPDGQKYLDFVESHR